MCEIYPGPRCSYDTDKKVKARTKAHQKAVDTYGAESHQANLAQVRLNRAITDWHSTPEGLEDLKTRAEKLKNETARQALQQEFDRAQRVRTMQVNAAKEIKSGRVAAIALLHTDASGFYTDAEILSVVESAREEQERFARRDELNIVDQEQGRYTAFLNRVAAELKTYQGGKLTRVQEDALDTLRDMPAPDVVNGRAYERVRSGVERSKQQLNTELARLGSLQNTSPAIAAAYYEGYRKQYAEKYAHLEDKFRPDPPREWVRGEEEWAGYTKNFSTNYAPHDPASLYALYRLRSDDDAIPDHLKSKRLYASVDLETASPKATTPEERKEALKPRNGRIIEVGIVTYNERGRETGRYSQLIRPEQNFLETHGTGAEDIHKISVSDLRGQPNWETVQAQVAKKLEGKILMGQNVEGFERGWLTHFVPNYNRENEVPLVDTLDIARKHYDLPNYKLKSICENVGVEYTNGHRALHDAEVAGAALFAMKRQIRKVWNSKDARRNAPLLKSEPMGSRWTLYSPSRGRL